MIRKFVNGRELARDLRTAVLAVIVASVVMAAPSVAARIVNADTVDHKHAVGAGATVQARAGKLVATNSNGRLPNNIIVKAGDADRLDGLNSTAFVAAKAKPGQVQSGPYGAWGGSSGSYVQDSILFRSALSAAISPSRVTFVPFAGGATAECPGPGHVVPRGWMCVYERGTGSTSGFNVYDPMAAAYGSGAIGFGIYATCGSTSCWTYGSWSVRAPDVVTLRTQGERPGATARVPALR